MPKQITDKTDIKLFTLEMLKQIDIPVDFVTLNSIVVQDGYVNGFDFMDCFYELSSTGAIEKLVDDNGNETFVITDMGKRACAQIDSPVISMIRGKATRSALALLSFHNRKAKVDGDISQDENGKYILSLRASDDSSEFFSLKLSFDSSSKAELFLDNYKRNPEFIYRSILGLLSGDINYLADAWEDDIESEEETDG